MIKVGIHGSTGKMGKEIISLIPLFNQCVLAYSYSRNSGNLDELCSSSDVILDFSTPDAVDVLLDKASQYNAKLLIGTTGLSLSINDKIIQLSEKKSVLQASNTSLGIALIDSITALIAKTLKDFSVDIIDIHHSSKKDAPSGTALMLGKTVAHYRKTEFVAHNHLQGLRPTDAIGFSAIRAGNVIGKHDIMFTDLNESITLSHNVSNRAVFAEGAIKAGIWLMNCDSGLYSMKDVLNINPL